MPERPPKFQFASAVWPGLAKLAEECGEVVQVVGKIIGTGGTMQFRDGTVIERDRLIEEIGDLTAIIDFVVYHALSADEARAVIGRARAKREQFDKWRSEEAAT